MSTSRPPSSPFRGHTIPFEPETSIMPDTAPTTPPPPAPPWSEPATARTSAVASIEPTPPSERPPRVTTPPGGVPSQPEAPYDVWRDRIRTGLDRLIYGLALVALVYLRRHDQLDVGTVAAVLLVAGVRPHNLLDAVGAMRGGGGGAARAVVVGVGAGALSWRSFFGTCLAAILAGLLIGGCAHRQPGDPGAVMAKVVLSTTRDVREGLCDRTLLGPVAPLNIDEPPRDLAGVVGQVRAWLCADALGSLLDLATELLTPRPSPSAESDGGTRDPSTSSPEDSSGSATNNGSLPSTPNAGEVSP